MRDFEQAFMTVVPVSTNHIMIKGRSENYLDIHTDVSSTDQIFLITKYGRYVIDDEGHIRMEE